MPIAAYLRMIHLKRCYRLGYESLVKEVKDSFSCWRFCHLALTDPVSDASTLINLTHKSDGATVNNLNDATLLKLKGFVRISKRGGIMARSRENVVEAPGFKTTVGIAGLIGLVGGLLFGIWDSVTVIQNHTHSP